VDAAVGVDDGKLVKDFGEVAAAVVLPDLQDMVDRDSALMARISILQKNLAFQQ